MRNTELVQVRNIQRVESSLFQTNDASSLLNSSLPEHVDILNVKELFIYLTTSRLTALFGLQSNTIKNLLHNWAKEFFPHLSLLVKGPKAESSSSSSGNSSVECFSSFNFIFSSLKLRLKFVVKLHIAFSTFAIFIGNSPFWASLCNANINSGNLSSPCHL
uniref:Uncharacterized protein n=1 Tax=Meloidogyne incognita TaxID=6306 RepID=A0A914KLH3_MELIC